MPTPSTPTGSDGRGRAHPPDDDGLEQLAEAKLSPPRLRSDLVTRARITRALDGGGDTSVTLLAAPAGYGKTTAVLGWCAARSARAAWVTLDSADDDPLRLWTYVATAVDRIREGLGRSALQSLRRPGSSPEPALDALANGIAAFPEQLVLVLDDLQSLTGEQSLASIDHLVDRLPRNARLFLLTRRDPALRLGQLRVRGALSELRAADLAFTADETAELFRKRGVALDPEAVATLCEHTEGWPAALELGALWLRGVDDPARSVREFSGSHRFVVDYLTHEALSSLDDDARSFLLHVSVLGRVTPELADGVLDRADSASVLTALERSNLLVTRLEQGDWYRIHPLLAEYARTMLASVEPGAEAVTRRRAAEWLRERGLVAEAVEHASAVGDDDLVVRILLEHHLALIRTGRTGTLFRWVRVLPDELVVAHPELGVAAATAATLTGGQALERRRLLALVDRALAARPSRVDPYVRSAAAMVRAVSPDHDVGRAVAEGREAVALAEAGADEVLVAALAAHACALYLAGELDEAWTAARRAIEHPDAERRMPGHALARSTLALIAAERGRLRTARIHAEAAKAIVVRTGTSRSWLGANASVALGVVLEGEGDLAGAEHELAHAEHSFRDEVATAHHAWLLVLLARVRCRRGRITQAADVLRAAREVIAELADSGRIASLAADVEKELRDASARAALGELVDAPTDAELAVLELLDSDLSSREIARRLFLSPNTVRSHMRVLYRKLGVNTRADAVARADALGLLSREPESSR